MTPNEADESSESGESRAETTEVEPAWPCPECGSADYNWRMCGARAAKLCEDCGHLNVSDNRTASV